VTQFNVLIDRLLAMWIGEWAPAALFYSERMIYFPLGVIATAMGTVLLPAFSSHAAEGNRSAMAETISHSLRHMIFIMTPAALGLMVLAPNILKAIFEWNGSFDAESTILSARALAFYAPGLVIFSTAKVFVPAFYAMQDTRTPVRIGIQVVLLNLIMNITFILTFPLYWKHAGMALATVLAEGFGIITLGNMLSGRVEGIQWKATFRTLVRSLLCALTMAAVAWFTALCLNDLIAGVLPAKITEIVVVIAAVAAGIGSYILLAIATRAPELHEIMNSMRKR
jgi:putative peptidoglycan lipid II flippase